MDFRDKIRRVREQAEEKARKRAEQLEQEKLTREALARRHEQWTDILRDVILEALRDFTDEFDHFHIEEALGHDGRIYAVYADELLTDSDGMPAKFYSRLEFTIRRYDHSGKLRLRVKSVIRNKERVKRSWSENLASGNIDSITEFVHEEIIIFARMYSSPDPEEEVHKEYHL